MVRRPDLGYRDEGVDFTDPAAFEAQRQGFGDARIMPQLAYRSLQFLYLEDEAIWTRNWIPVGTVHEVPQTGDLLPFTLGYHGVHLQRTSETDFVGRFNLAQHGGCRVVPTQCQQGKRTGCSFTSCGYSRDRGPIHVEEGNDDNRTMYQYVGLRPERLHPVHVAQTGALLLLNIDPDASAHMPEFAELPLALSTPESRRVDRHWVEFKANWKLSGQELACVDKIHSSDPQQMRGHRCAADGSDLQVRWLFPNTIILENAGECCVVVLQHTALDETLFRVEILTTAPFCESRRDFWEAELRSAGARAATLQQAIPAKTPLASPATPHTLPLQADPAAWWFQTVLIDRIRAMPRVESDVPMFRNVENYLI